MHTHWRGCPTVRLVRVDAMEPGMLIKSPHGADALLVVERVESTATGTKLTVRKYRGRRVFRYGTFPDSVFDLVDPNHPR